MLIMFIPNGAMSSDDVTFQLDPLEAEGYVAFVVNADEPDNEDSVLKPDPDAKKCICKGTGIITHGDGHTTDCPYHGDKGEPTPTVVPEVQTTSCRCETGSTFCNCVATYGSCSCQKKTTRSEPLTRIDIPTALLVDKKKDQTLSKDKKSTRQILCFTAPAWCGPCLAMQNEVHPHLRESGWVIDTTKKSHIKLLDIDLPTNEPLYQSVGKGRGIPLYIMMIDGVEVDAIEGQTDSNTLAALWNNN